MDDGGFVGSGVRISCNAFSLEEVTLLIKILKTNFNLDCTIQNIEIENKYSIYIKKNSLSTLVNLVYPYFHKSMYYKLGLKN